MGAGIDRCRYGHDIDTATGDIAGIVAIAKRTCRKVGFVDLTGSFNQSVGPPRLRKTRKIADGRMLAVILIVEKKGVYFLKMAGDNKTVSSAAVAFRNSFGAKADKEKPREGESKK